MDNNAIVLLNTVGFPRIIPVDNFKDENIKDAICKTLNVDAKNLVCITIGNPCIYGITEKYPKLQNVLEGVSPFYSEYPKKHEHYIRVLCAVW